MRIGIDTGGTFTDCVILEGSEIKILKVFSTPDDAARGILDGARRLTAGSRGEPLDVIHGTTVGTNSLLERRGARVALVTTAGFEDLIEIGRQNRPRLYDLNVHRDPPLVPRSLRWGIRERTAWDGSILLRPRTEDLRRLGAAIKRSGIDSIALCFLFSFANPSNERSVARALRKLQLPVSVSHEILPEFREYERLSTVVINAYLAPKLGAYLRNLERMVGEGLYVRPLFRAGKPCPTGRASEAQNARGRIYVMQSNGGITTAGRAAREPVRTILSGPAGGVVAAAWLAERRALRCAISFDMGGTSTDVCLIEGAPRTTRETTLAGLPVAVPVLDVHSVGAGGGSMARFDLGGALRVGPESAAASPGPACYGRGGTRPTVTDAHLLLGRLDPEHFLGGTFRLDLSATEKAFAGLLRQQRRARRTGSAGLGTSFELARGIVAVSNATMERALRVISVERGHDPRDLSLICFGGAGGLHAADLARSLELQDVIVPPDPGAFSALGILLSDIVKDVSRSVLLPVAGSNGVSRRKIAAAEFGKFLRKLEREFTGLESAARAELRGEHFPSHLARAERRLDVRYAGQAYDLSVPFTPAFSKQFQAEHEKTYGYAHADRPLEVVNLRVRLVIRTPKPPLRARASRPQRPRAAPLKVKPVWFAGGFRNTPFYARERLRAGARLDGPAVVVEYSSATVVPPDCVCRVDEYLNLVLTNNGS